MRIKVIKNESDYQAALDELDRLLGIDPDIDTKDGERLELLALLIEDYETRTYPVELPTAIDAIEFFMDQKGLDRKSLIPYLGSASKVSEVLAGKRPLSISMIRALHDGLGIPTDMLLRQDSESSKDADFDWAAFPLKEMRQLGWIDAELKSINDNPEPIVREFFHQIGGIPESRMFLRRTHNIHPHVRSFRNIDPYALQAWRGQVLRESLKADVSLYNHSVIDAAFLKRVVGFSPLATGPLIARDFLAKYGIALIAVKHLKKTYLDGAAFIRNDGTPVIGMTFRYDRIDNFWFVLLHELVHVWKHIHQENLDFFDDLDPIAGTGGIDSQEQEADTIALEMLIPMDKWEDSGARHLQSAHETLELARQLKIHPAIVAGRIRRETNNYKKLNRMVGNGEIGKLFFG